VRVSQLRDLRHARGCADANGNDETIGDQVRKKDVLATTTAIVGAIEYVCDVTPRIADFDAEGLRWKGREVNSDAACAPNQRADSGYV
jgi:hypothetical protein